MAGIVFHYSGNGKPNLEEERCVTVCFTCEDCKEHIGLDDRHCKHCGVELDHYIDAPDGWEFDKCLNQIG